MDDTKYHYDELIKLLIILSLDSEVQLEAYGIGNVEDEIACDIETYFTLYKGKYLVEGYLDEKQLGSIEKIDKLITDYSKIPESKFWSHIETHEGWKSIRRLAKEALVLLGKEKAKIKVEVENTYGDTKDQTAVQRIKIEIIE